MMKRIIFTFIVIFLFSCNKTTGPVLSDVTTTEATLKNLQIDIISSDSLIIRNGDSLLVNAMDVVKISVFEEHEDSLVFLKTIAPSYKNVGSLLGLEFSIPIKVLYPNYRKDFILQFHMSDDTILEVKAYADMYKYTYENVERWFRFADIGSISPYREVGWLCAPQYTYDFEINNENFYFNIGYCGAWGVSKYNINNGESEYVSNIIWDDGDSTDVPLTKPMYAAGTHLAVDGDYLFVDCSCDNGGIFRINMLTNSTSVFIDAGWGETNGIEAANDTLYFIIENDGYFSNKYNLRICDYDGNLLNSVSLPLVVSDNNFGTYNGIESYRGILYIWNKDNILRLKLSDLTFLTPLVAPHNWNGGFDIHDGVLYYALDDVYWIELSELREVE